jgi:hypothetical protein
MGSLKRLFLPLLFLPLALGCAQDADAPDSSFKNMKALRDSGYLDEGWIPPCLSESSREIFEQHNRDTHQTWISFQLPAEDLGDFKKRLLGPLEPDQFVSSRLGAPSWWPSEFPGAVWLFRCVSRGNPKDDLRALVDEAQGRVFLWRDGY